MHWLTRLALGLALLAPVSGCGTVTHSISQSSLVPLPTAPPPPGGSGGVALDLGAQIPTDASMGSSSGASGLSVPVAEPFGAASVRVADFIALRGVFNFVPAEGQRQLSGSIDGPGDGAFVLGLGATFRMLFADDIIYLDVGPTVGFAMIPSTEHVIRTTTWCDVPGDGCPEPEVESYDTSFYEPIPLLGGTLRLGFRPIEWLAVDVGVTVRNQPTNEAAFTTGSYPDSSVSPGPFALLLHGGVRLDVIDELGFAAELTWPATNVEVRYGPIVSLSVQGRIDGSRADLFGLSI